MQNIIFAHLYYQPSEKQQGSDDKWQYVSFNFILNFMPLNHNLEYIMIL